MTAAGQLSMIAALTGLPHSRRDGWKRTAASCESRLSVLGIGANVYILVRVLGDCSVKVC